MRRSLPLADFRQPDAGGWFTSRARYWQDVYDAAGLDAEIYRRRMTTVIEMLDGAGFRPGSLVLDAGCGAGQLAVELARRGARVVGSDLSEQMTEMTRDALRDMELRGLVVRSDASRLPVADATFDFAIALGLLPWVACEQAVVRELARVTRAGGYVLLTFDNELRLFGLVDPLLTPVTRPIRRVVRSALNYRSRGNRVITPRRAESLVREAGLQTVRTTGIGFGPPTFFGRAVVRGGLALRLHSRLQHRAAGESSRLHRLGAHFIILARR